MLEPVIAIDFDDTYTSDVKMWYGVVSLMQRYGHKVICATARSWSEANEHDLTQAFPPGVKVVFSGMKPKRIACQNAGYDVQIWCDDCPAAIEPDSWVNWQRLKMCGWKLYYALLRKLCPKH